MERVKPPTTQEAVLAALRRALASGELRPGEQVRQEQLAERYGVSRVPLREALKILEGEGRMTYHPHRGYFVAELSIADLHEVYRLREILEAEAIAAAVPAVTPGRVALLRDAADDVRRASAARDLAAVSEANRRFHFLLFSAAGRPVLNRMLGQLWDATDAYRTVYFEDAGHLEHIDREHTELVAALAAGDGEAATRVQAAHREHSLRSVTATLQGRVGADSTPEPTPPVV